MKLERKTKIMSMSHDDLVDFFSTALYGSYFLGCDYDKDFYNSLPEEKKFGDCYEDKIADTLLNGGKIYMYDGYAEGETYGINESEILEDETAMYTIDLHRLFFGLEQAANGTYNVHNDSQYVLDCFNELVDMDNGNLDQPQAESLMQIVMFNELVYG
jgi:hypothetical protein